MYLKSHLGFLPGFPARREGARVVWIPLAAWGSASSGTVELTVEHLRRAAFGWNKLSVRFAKVLSRIVGDAEGWRHALPKLLGVLAAGVHEGAALPASLFDSGWGFPRTTIRAAHRAARRSPRLRGFLDALSWASCLDPGRAAHALSWLAAHHAPVEGLLGNLAGVEGITTALVLSELAERHGDGRILPILAVLGYPEAPHVPTHGGCGYLAAWSALAARALRRKRPIAASCLTPPPADWFSQVRDFLGWLHDQPLEVGRAAADIFGMTVPQDLLPRWRDWWQRVESATATARRLIMASAGAPRQAGAAWEKQVRAVTAELDRLAAEAPPSLPQRETGRRGDRRPLIVRRLAQPELQAVRGPLIRILENIDIENQGVLARVDVLAACAQWLVHGPVAKIARLLRALLNTGIPRERLELVIRDDDCVWDILYCDAPPERACRALAVWLGPLRQITRLDWPIAVSRASDDADKVRACLGALARKELLDLEPEAAAIDTAVRLASDANDFPELARAAKEAYAKDYRFWITITPAVDALRRAGWGHLVPQSVRGREFAVLSKLATWSKLARCLGENPEPAPCSGGPEAPGWAARYPAALRASLALLAQVAPDAERSAASVLGAVFPALDAVRGEIAALEERSAAAPADPRLARRLANLRRRLAGPAAPSQRRLEHLDAKLHRAIRRHVYDAWQESLHACLERNVAGLLGVADFPPWLTEERHQQSLAAILALSGWARSLGLRLLRLRCGPPPWNLAGEPANRRFIARLRAAGIDPAAWLDPPAPATVVGQNGRRVQLAFANDPLEIFQMGAPFNTCLSPGDVNFFSTVANAADINKHVVLARNPQGQVVGRCLLAVSNDGGLMAFHPYCHDPELGFGRMIAAVLNDLAARMRTVVVRRGTVPSLVAGNWYDDGAEDLGNRFPCLENGSALREALKTVDAAAVIALVEASLAPVALGSLTLPLLLSLPEVAARPELAVPLLPRIETTDNLALETLIHAAKLAHRAGATAEARHLLRARAEGPLFRDYRSGARYHGGPLSDLVEIDPWLVLKILHGTRPRGVQKDEHESGHRRGLLAAAYARIGRPAKANRLTPRKKPRAARA
jgi:hypothetical protein